MEQQDLLHQDSSENQNQEVNSGTSIEGQNITENQTPAPTEDNQPVETAPVAEEPATEPVTAPETTPETAPVAEEPAAEPVTAPETTPETAPVAEEPAAEPVTAPETTPETAPVAEANVPKPSASDLMSEIDRQVQTTEREDEEETQNTETIEQIETEYKEYDPEQCVTELERLVEEPDFNLIKQRVGVLRAKLIDFFRARRHAAAAEKAEHLSNPEDQATSEPDTNEPDEIEIRFNTAFQHYKDSKAKYIESLEEQKQKNLEAKNQIIEGLKTLIETESNLKTLNDKFKELQEQWKAIGPVPQNDSTNLWQNYHFYVEKFFDILRINKEMRSLDLKKNLESKLELCEKAESLLLVDSISQSFKELQTLHEQWKEIGPVPDDKKEEIWERFKTASDQINQRRKEHYDKLFAEEQNNYNAKVVLCEQVEELTSHPADNVKEYNEISDKLADILNIWKTLGPAPSKLNDEIWKRFKSTLDKFFQQKKDFFQQIKDSQMQNYNQKVNLAIQAEGISGRTDWKEATHDIINLQAEWKKIGAVPRKYSDQIWKRFRSACDKFFEAKSHYFGNVQEVEDENLKQKEELIQKILSHEFGDDRNANMDIMKSYQNDWIKIGYVPKKDKDRIYTAYREALDKRFADLKISSDDFKHTRFQSKIDTILNDPNANKLIDKEKRFLLNKVSQLKEDINLWENNLGFFAKSKNADVITQDFRKKIENAKKEVQDLEYKIRMMNHPKPKAEEPKAEEPKAEEPKAEEPKAEEPKAEEPKAEEPKAEEPKAEEPKAEEPKAEEPKAEDPKAEE